MTRRSLRTVGALALALAASTLAGFTAAEAGSAAPQHTCAGAFCSDFDLVGFDALAPTQVTSAAAQPTKLALRFTDTSPAVGTDKTLWFSKVSAVLGTSSSKGYAVAAPSTLPLGAYVAGSSATAATCAPGSDGSGYATTCPAGFGTGLIGVSTPPVVPETIKPAFFGIKSVTVGAGGTLSADVSVFVPGVSLPMVPTSTSTTVTFAAATATTGPTLTMGTQPAITTPPPPYTAADLSLNQIALNLNGLVTEAATGPVHPAVAFVRQPTLCTSLTSTMVAQARSSTVAAVQFPSTITGCPTPPGLVSAIPVAGNPKAFTFTMKPPTAAVTGRAASLEWVFGDGAKASTGATTTHTYAVAQPVIALVTTVDSAGARSASLQVKIGTGALRAKQKSGNRLAGELTDQATDDGLGDQEVLAYHCATKNTLVADCEAIGTTVTQPNGSFRLKIPTVKKKGSVLVAFSGTATLSATQPARFGTSRFVDVLPQPKVTLNVSDKTVHRGAIVRLSGTVSPGKKGKTIRLQSFIHGKWRSIGKATVSKKGTYATTYQVKVPGQQKVKVRAVLPGTAATLVSRSKPQVIKVS